MNNTLTPKQKRFCEEYIIDLNPKQALIRSGYSEKSSTQTGSRVLAKPHIKEHIAELIKQRSERTGITADKVLLELDAIAFSDIRDFVEFSEEGLKVKPVCELSPEQARAIKIITGDPSSRGSTFSVRLHDKLRALELLCRHLGMFTDKVELPQFNSFKIGYGTQEEGVSNKE